MSVAMEVRPQVTKFEQMSLAILHDYFMERKALACLLPPYIHLANVFSYNFYYFKTYFSTNCSDGRNIKQLADDV